MRRSSPTLRATSRTTPVALVVALAALLLAATACTPGLRDSAAPPTGSATAGAGQTPAEPTPTTPSEPPEPTEPTEPPEPPGPVPSDGTPRDALLSIPALGIVDLVVQAYEGRTDDAPGTEIQDGGIAASPYGAEGGTGPGGVGNYQVTAHRLSSTRAFEFLPDLVDGDVVQVRVDALTYSYEVVETHQVSFRDPASLAAQRAAVPGQPGVTPTEAMITLSTCRTPEDRAEGNWWSDEFGNPEHRIDKIGRLVEVTGA
ncbi:sortase [Nocardioides zeae]|uniref:Sortase n=1 Tax=Nocardioides imazamoxiresistens TaxID=3231893 RepID=A0ABU3PWK8_9ACTN|nr:sortase [Nocardioides zeae]MDT9593615.1 sortase [Nocardioides zeae]